MKASFVSQIPLLKYGVPAILAVAISLPAGAQTGTPGTGTGTGTGPVGGFGTGTPGTTPPSGFGSQVGPVFCSIQTTTGGTGTATGTGTTTAIPGTSGFSNPQCALTGQVGKPVNFAFVAEGTLPASFVLAQTQPLLDAALFHSVSSGQAELRERVTFPTSNNMMTIEYFAVPTGTALPFPATPLAAPGTVFARLNVMVQNIIFTDGSSPSVLLDGTVQASPLGASVFGDVVGRAAAVSLGVMPPLTIPGLTDMTGATGTMTGGTTEVPPVAVAPTGTTNATMLQVMVAGGFVTATPTAASTLSFGTSTTPGTGGGGTGGTEAPIVTIAQAPASVTQRQIMLDASASSNPGGGPLTFSWASIGNLAAISQGKTATPIVTFDAGPRDYIFEVTVTNAQGFSTVGTITVHYTGL